MPRQGEEVKRIPIPAGFVFHHANAFEEGEKVILDSICYDSIAQLETGTDFRKVNFEKLDPAQLWRFTIDLAAETVERQLLLERSCEFPVVHPGYVGRPYRYLYAGAVHQPTGNAPLQAITKVDLKTGQETAYSFAPRGFASEPTFVPYPNGTQEDEGWLLCQIYNAERHCTQLVILAAETMTHIATLTLGLHIPYPLHGTWTPHCFQTAPAS